ncbi:PP2C family serine/threonine-protein phosphatase [Nannocystis bainbridge]|uniref:PP2C family serine/threonine-protein phosphatase n=1 Tax=Nannocystis bainbridge TaxID=2995303 RepID=A0ABT5ECJ1_9BACT|nr:PP2C family serine/threonine-protein phosphatase [Nannocystis bainbridge]MDC0723576.1 PP2C family serine/threonine-protein phosphatase [Nannocystis bainbridge]
MISWQVVGASVRGPEHEREGSPGQDAWAQGPFGAHGACLCLCDGAGSASHAEVGARVVAEAVVAALTGTASGPEALVEALRGACTAGRAALLREAAEIGVAPAALACTLVAVVCSDERVAIAHLGDGVAVGRRADSGELVVLSAPDRGEYFNETWFVTSDAWQARLRIAVHEGIAGVCALTDGCQEAALVRGAEVSPYSPFFAPLFAFAAEVTDGAAASAEVVQLLDGAAMRKSSGDDKTLALAWRPVP